MSLAKILGVLAFALFLALYGFQGWLEYQDLQKELAEYCGNVKDGTWPDFSNKYDEQCKENFGPIEKKFVLHLDTNQF